MIREILVGTFLLLGVLFVLLAALGAMRFRDPILRMAAVSKASTLGLTLILLSTVIYDGTFGEALKSLAIILILWMSSPLAAHLLARSALSSGSKLLPQTQHTELREELLTQGQTKI